MEDHIGWLVGWLVEGESSLPTNLELREFFFFFSECMFGRKYEKAKDAS